MLVPVLALVLLPAVVVLETRIFCWTTGSWEEIEQSIGMMLRAVAVAVRRQQLVESLACFWFNVGTYIGQQEEGREGEDNGAGGRAGSMHARVVTWSW